MRTYKRASKALESKGFVIRIKENGRSLWIVDVELNASIEIVEPDGSIRSWISVQKLRELGNGNLDKGGGDE